MLIMLMMTRKIRMIKTMMTMMNLLVKRLPGNVDDGASVHSGTSDWGQRARNTVCTRSSPTLNLFVALNLIVFFFLGLVFRRPSPNLNWFQSASKGLKVCRLGFQRHFFLQPRFPQNQLPCNDIIPCFLQHFFNCGHQTQCRDIISYHCQQSSPHR